LTISAESRPIVINNQSLLNIPMAGHENLAKGMKMEGHSERNRRRYNWQCKREAARIPPKIRLKQAISNEDEFI